LTGEQQRRWATVLDHLTAALPAAAARVLVDGLDEDATLLAERLAERLRAAGTRAATQRISG
jgi:hypothetical protein